MYLAKSLFVFQLGENDYSIQLVNGSTVDEASKNIPRIVNTIISGVEKLMTLGTVDIVVSDIAPMGCFPFYLSMFESSNKSDYDKYGCLRNHNALFKRHNSFLQSSLPKLQKKHPRTRIMYADLASHIYQIVQDPRKFGFETALMSCCGKAGAPHRFDPFNLCGMNGSSVCHDPGSHLLWDGMHLSDTANRWIAEGWLSGPYCHPPILQ
nr:GDSL esterase/lipase At2g27360-like [Aegilops tauschii subsp. strangulata]